MTIQLINTHPLPDPAPERPTPPAPAPPTTEGNAPFTGICSGGTVIQVTASTHRRTNIDKDPRRHHQQRLNDGDGGRHRWTNGQHQPK
jgi:hypothetical protein